ncbi:MAG: alpha-glucan family phosphorylase [Bacteroidetes bacterium]|nr:alpha-glucan family phosphorylase [Bacteroidota bacterium]
MTVEPQLKPDYLFEVSWEVCNKVGGIYTVLATKAQTIEKEWHERLIMVGPDVWKGTGENPEFIEDKTLFKLWRQHIDEEGLKIKIGRWKIPGAPIVVLVDFTPYFFEKNQIFAHLWVKYQLDSLTGQWDYIEPAMFGYAAGKVIECYYRCHINSTDKVVALFHEWMTGAGILYLEEAAPQIATVFITHATVLGRVIAGNGLPFYKEFENYNPNTIAREFNVIAKYSLEKVAANIADCFTTVSNITSAECQKFLGKPPDIITPNGFDISIVPDKQLFDKKRASARAKILKVAEALFNQAFAPDSMLIIKSGRYEFKNKGIDLFIDSLAEINDHLSPAKNVIAVIFVPGHQTGPRKELLERLVQPDFSNPMPKEILTHNLQGAETDLILQRIKQAGLSESTHDKIKVIFVPTYMNGDDGVFNMSYYELLIGFDMAVFPSYYEPWGYTPLESLAFHVPSVTTNVSGFGAAINSLLHNKQKGIQVIDRTDDNERDVVVAIAATIDAFSKKSVSDIEEIREDAYNISQGFLWERQIKQYEKAYDIALKKSEQREELYRNKPQAMPATIPEVAETKPLWRSIIIYSEMPERLNALQVLSKNLWWSWDSEATSLFESIDPWLWETSHCNPIVLLQIVSHTTLKRLESDAAFVSRLDAVAEKFNTYMHAGNSKKGPQIAYFCMEYGLHNSLKLYSGGLGILAGDYLKEASDANINITGIGLLYKNGYFKQSLSIHGEQLTELDTLDFTKLPLELAKDSGGKPLKIALPFPSRTVIAQVWKLPVGRVPLYLLDTLLAENSAEDRLITSQLYASPEENRLKQELLLGVGGILLLNALGIKPDVYHCNEGHPAFLNLARLYNFIHDNNLSFEEALEIVRATNIFTTHTSLPAAIDKFSEELLRPYLSHTAQQFNISWETLINLGRTIEDTQEQFSMTTLALKLSGEVNAVSKLHRKVSCLLFNSLWKNYMPEELNIGYVTNGVHYATWTAGEWKALHEKVFDKEFFNSVSDAVTWQKIYNVPNEDIWGIRKVLKNKLLNSVKERLSGISASRHEGPRKLAEAIVHLTDDALLIGFARRFVSYKRPDLLLHDLNRLSTIINNIQKPVLLFFSGKAHPSDKSSIDLVKRIVDITEMPEFRNKVFFLEDYDMNLAKLLVQGVDLWINVPNRYMEASGTSGMKAMLNGVLNFSVLDGWWAEAYNEHIGWALETEPSYERQDYQDELDSENLYRTLENEIIPLFFERDEHGIPVGWVKMIKASIAAAPTYTMGRVLGEYQNNYYNKLHERGRKLSEENYCLAKQLAAWKKQMLLRWNEVDVISISSNMEHADKNIEIKIVLDIGDLSINDVGLEIVFLRKNAKRGENLELTKELNATEINRSYVVYECKMPALQPGAFEYSFRIFPKNPLLIHRQDFGLAKWV